MLKINNIPSCRFNSGVMCATSCTGEGCGWHPETASIRKSAIREERKKSMAHSFAYTIPSYKGKCKLTYITSYGVRIVELRGMVNMSDIMELAAAGNTDIRFEYKGV